MSHLLYCFISNFSYTYVYAADETSVWLDPSGGTRVSEKGAKTVTVLSTGHEKARVTSTDSTFRWLQASAICIAPSKDTCS